MTYGLEIPPRINLQCTCTGQILNRNDSTILVQGQVAKVAIALGVTEEWANLITVARFRHEGSLAVYDIEVDENYEVEVPHEMTDDAGTFSMSLKGEGDNRVITSSPVSFNVIETITGKGKTSEPTETILDRFSEASKKAQENANLAKTYADSADSAKSSASSSEAKARTYSETAKSSETIAVENANKSQALLDEAKRLDRFHVNYLTKTESDDSFIHVDDAFEGGRLRGFKIKGKCEQITTTGANLWPQIESFKMDGAVFEPYPDRHGHADRGMVRVSGTSTVANVYAGVRVELESGTYRFKNFGYYVGSSASESSVYLRVRVISVSGSQSTYTAFGSNAESFAVSDGDTVYLDVVRGAAGPIGGGYVKPMLVKGSVLSGWEQYTGGKASPSPEYPQEIDVVSTLKLTAAGRNIIDWDGFPFVAPLGKTSVATVATSLPKMPDYSIAVDASCDGTIGSDSAMGSLKNFYDNYYYQCYSSDGSAFDKKTSFAEPTMNPLSENPKRLLLGTYSLLSGTFTMRAAMLVPDKKEDADKKYGTTAWRVGVREVAQISLPSEHPYLASLPDGTCDEVEVDETGHAVLTARVSRVAIDDFSGFDSNSAFGDIPIKIMYTLLNDARPNDTNALAVRARRSEVNYFKSEYTSLVDSYGNVVMILPPDIESFDVAKAVLGAGSFVYYPSATSTAYDLGYVDMPLQQDRYCNFWVDTGAEETDSICPLEVTYERDVNIVIEDLEKHLSSS